MRSTLVDDPLNDVISPVTSRTQFHGIIITIVITPINIKYTWSYA